MKLTVEKIELLKAIDDLCNESEYGVAQVKEIMLKLNKNRGAVAKQLRILNREGYVENPLWGAWRLTELGKKTLKEVMEANV